MGRRCQAGVRGRSQGVLSRPHGCTFAFRGMYEIAALNLLQPKAEAGVFADVPAPVDVAALTAELARLEESEEKYAYLMAMETTTLISYL